LKNGTWFQLADVAWTTYLGAFSCLSYGFQDGRRQRGMGESFIPSYCDMIGCFTHCTSFF